MTRILVVDDDENVRATLCSVFTAHGNVVTEAGGGETAILLHRGGRHKQDEAPTTNIY